MRKILSRHKQKQSHNSESCQSVVLDQRREDEGRWKGGLELKGRGDKNLRDVLQKTFLLTTCCKLCM